MSTRKLRISAQSLCPLCHAYLIQQEAEDLGNDKIRVRYRCEYCGAIVRRIYKVKLVKEEVDP